MRIIDELTNQEITNPDLRAGELQETQWASPEALDTIDNVTKFALDDSDWETVQIYHRYTAEEIAQREYNDERQGISDLDLMAAIAKAVTIPQKPAQKVGFITVWHYDAATNHVVWTFEPDPEAKGTPDNPYGYAAGVPLIPNAYYMHEDVRYVFVAVHGRTATDWATDGPDMEPF